MFLYSGIDLFDKSAEFVNSSDEVTIFSPYIKLEQIKILNYRKKVKRIIVRWEIRDLCLGVSDLDLYLYCKENNIALFRNTRIHLKVIWNHYSKLLFGSANITNKGIGEVGEYNFELNSIIDNIDFATHNYLNKIIFESEYVNDELFEKINNLVLNTKLPIINFPELPTIKKLTDFFLISQLPMSFSPVTLFNLTKSLPALSFEEFYFVSHDLILFDLKIELTEEEFFLQLKSKFNFHPFIVKFKQFVDSRPNKSIHYGGCVAWIQENTTTVPTPRSWEMKKNQMVNILYEWICFFDPNFVVERPNYSEILKIK